MPFIEKVKGTDTCRDPKIIEQSAQGWQLQEHSFTQKVTSIKKASFRAKTLEIKLKRPHQLMMEVESETLSRANPSLFLFFSEVGTILSL